MSSQRTLPIHDFLTILHYDCLHSERLTDYCEYYHSVCLTYVFFCRCTSPCSLPRIFCPETKSKSQKSKFCLYVLGVFRGNLTHVVTTRLDLTNESHMPFFLFFLVAVAWCPTNDVRNLTVQLFHTGAKCDLHSLLLGDLSDGYFRIIIVVQLLADHSLKKFILYRSRGSNSLNVFLTIKEGRVWRSKDKCATVSLINQNN